VVTLVTGGSGFIGQHLVAALLRHGRRVRILNVRAPTCHPGERSFSKGQF
jgi:dihydroflavonol-4-reductase